MCFGKVSKNELLFFCSFVFCVAAEELLPVFFESEQHGKARNVIFASPSFKIFAVVRDTTVYRARKGIFFC